MMDRRSVQIEAEDDEEEVGIMDQRWHPDPDTSFFDTEDAGRDSSFDDAMFSS